MCSCYLIFTVLAIVFSEPVMSSWEFAVSSKSRINFYTSDWEPLTSAAHQFDELSAIAFDETEETLYFNDQKQLNDTILSLKLQPNENHFVESIVRKIRKENVQGIAFDLLERILYWTDAANDVIYQMNLNGKQEPSIFAKNLNKPHGIAIDVCRRKLYWTNANMKNSSIGRISLDGTGSEIIIDSDLEMPRGIVIDQTSHRIFWIDDLTGDHFSVESADLDGNDRKLILRNMNHAPYGVTTDETHIYWTDTQENAVWKISKNATSNDIPVKVKNFTQLSPPKGIINRGHFMEYQANNPDCRPVINLIKSSMNSSTLNKLPQNTEIATMSYNIQCLNDGHFDNNTQSCQCQMGYKGDHCEIPVCFNYCIEGTCHVSSTGNPQCVCRPGFNGERCENDLCNNHCLHGGHCMIEYGEPNCQCPPSFYGNRCENMDIKEMCTRFCNKEDVNINGYNLETICNDCNIDKIPNLGSYLAGERESSCKDSGLNKTAIFVSAGVVISLALIVVIVISIRHVYKPLRPRIKKTYVVRKNVTPTPLTCRPTTEQCEITIENCCNMNICDTPCFDPKILQAEANKKEDKKTLLNNSEDLMY